MAYAILSHSGVDVGKQDFLGPVNLVNKLIDFRAERSNWPFADLALKSRDVRFRGSIGLGVDWLLRSSFDPFRRCRDARLESAIRSKADDVGRQLWICASIPWEREKVFSCGTRLSSIDADIEQLRSKKYCCGFKRDGL
jgi:hypothetical protein